MSLGVIGIVHNKPLASGHEYFEASQDVLAQVEAIEEAISALGFKPTRILCTRDLRGFISRIRRRRLDMAFNLCETLDEDPRLSWLPAAVLELLGVSFSGAPSAALMLTTDKLLTKRLLKATRIRTPSYLLYNGHAPFHPEVLRFPVIVKPRFEDAGIGIDQGSIFEEEGALKEGLKVFFNRFGALLVEEYIDGREFNISLYGYPSAKVLPIAEIDFSAFPGDLYRIVGYRAKWDRSSSEFDHTPREFPNDLSDLLEARLASTACRCFSLLGLRDYGRVDVRVDAHGRIYVLEVNANPCLSPDAGFAAAAERAGMTFTKMVGGFVDFMARRARQDGRQTACHSTQT